MNKLNHSRTLARLLYAAAMLVVIAESSLAAVRYVDLNSANPTVPYTSWAMAATNIQDAVDAAVAGDEIVVTNGIYATGGRGTVTDSTTNRVVVDKPLSLRTVNGPQSTAIDGGQSVRCVYLTNGASLSGFTLTDGRAPLGGGLWCESANAVVSNCVVSGNASFGHTIFVGNGTPCCGLFGPFAGGGGVYGGTLYDCTLSDNWAETHSFWSWGCSASFCVGGIDLGSMLYYWRGAGGGAANATLNNCTLTANWAAYGGGAYGCTLNNCTLTGNTAAYTYSYWDGQAYGSGGGAYHSVLNNCIIYFNTAADGPNYDSDSTLNYCCATPQPAGGTGNISADPQLASSSHLSANSPCRGAGSPAYASGTDIDGETWASSPSIGCDEYHPGAVTGPLSVGITATVTNVVGGFTVQFTASIAGRITASSWDFGDGTTATNQPYTSHAWTAPGNYAVVLRAYNESHPAGISTTLTVHLGTVVHYAATGSPNPVAPYTSWGTAATNIQDAIDAAVAGDEIVVTNGIYATGARVTVSDGASNRVVVDKLLIVRSVNGPQFTFIDGGQSVRCVYLTNGASLSGFTLTKGGFFNGHAGGGVFGESVAAVVSNCTLSGNHAGSGGGASNCTLNNCTLSGNSAAGGGGADGCILNNCALSGNAASYNSGGGASGSTLNNCTITGNSSDTGGGGAYNSTLKNCIVYFNDAPQAANYDSSSTLNFCCTSPQPTKGVGNISLDPQLASASRLSAGSPCRGAGNTAYVTGTDIDGDTWADPPSIGCDEYHNGSLTGPLGVGIAASFTNVLAGFTVQLTGLIEGRTSASVWDFGDGVTIANQPYTSHAWTAPGNYAVVLRAYNESQPGGISATVTVHVVTGIHYVAAASSNPVAPYTSWATAATNIQDAVDAAVEGGAVVLVTNGVYATGGRFRPGFFPLWFDDIYGTTNRVVIERFLTVRSVNGPQVTSIDGGQSVRCVYLAGSATLSGFTLTNGNSDYGGGASGGTLNNCTLIGNSAYRRDQFGDVFGEGGGAAECILNNCTLTGNSAWNGGGGAADCTLYNCILVGNSVPGSLPNGGGGGGAVGCTLNNCTLSGNSAQIGGGAWGGTLNNCIVYFNTAPQGPNYDSYDTINYCCTTPQPTNGIGNITNAPLFVDQASGNLRLQSNSPCINAGNNAYASGSTDLDGRPRIVGGTIDIGAYEFQPDVSGVFIGWLQQYGLPIDGSADFTDPDGDGLNNWQEWRCGTDPTNVLSVLRLLAPVAEDTYVVVTWQSATGITYSLERTTSLGASSVFTPMATAIRGQPGTTTYIDTNAIGAGPWFYRVGVGAP